MLKGFWLGVMAAVILIPSAAAQSDLLNRGKSLFDRIQGEGDGGAAALSDTDIASGLKEALRVGSEQVVARLGRADGFNADPAVHIPLPDSLKTVQQTLGRVGMGGMLDDLELRLNRAAESATPKARAIFRDAIAAMTWDDVRKIFEGPEDAATQYLRSKMSDPLKSEMRPVVDGALADVGAVRSYDAAIARYKAVPFVPDVKADLTEHVLQRGLDGIFRYIAAEEAAIRRDPAKRTTELLRKVFGAQ